MSLGRNNSIIFPLCCVSHFFLFKQSKSNQIRFISRFRKTTSPSPSTEASLPKSTITKRFLIEGLKWCLIILFLRNSFTISSCHSDLKPRPAMEIFDRSPSYLEKVLRVHLQRSWFTFHNYNSPNLGLKLI